MARKSSKRRFDTTRRWCQIKLKQNLSRSADDLLIKVVRIDTT